MAIKLNKRRLVTSMLISASLVFIARGLMTAVTGDQSTSVPAGVDRLVPGPGDLVLRQAQIGIDLSAGYRGELVVDGQIIPTYDLSKNDCAITTTPFLGRDAVFDPGQNTVYFQPSPGATIERFAPGEHQIIARYWKLCEDPVTAKQFAWSFKVT